ncbi:MAG: phosphomannose isomerase type II C-terminal cupin domain [Candidatus Zambryskibacteria bacterium]|nr:phosphomannose isomerase type II C-terminal cupin domain [Candidatus Zambryskibacteria bacterium]
MKELNPFTEKRPWGEFREFVRDEAATVKIIFVKKWEAFSLQKHHNRAEFWRVLSGEPDITIGEKTTRAKVGDEFEIPIEASHRVSAPVSDVEVLEISRGKFDESDIVRIEDKYGRA